MTLIDVVQGDRVRDTKGNVVTLDDDARKAKIKESQDQINKFCNQ